MPTLTGGPLEGMWWPHFRGGKATLVVDVTPRRSILDNSPRVYRRAVYRVRTDEDGTAGFVGWEDELVAAAAEAPLAEAVGTASDEELLALIAAMAAARRP